MMIIAVQGAPSLQCPLMREACLGSVTGGAQAYP